ncbi:hypothetical protein BJV82DRAFT_196949 [Fennellomyces sp. T-0311]|nr:hypothetical protein BJV82DRAFT_196949 [Fennellomyces sp. T-0311]
MHGYRRTGYLLIKTTGKMGTGFDRYYFELKNDVLEWHESATDMYSPKGKVDLKDALAVRTSKKREHGFKIITMNKTWHIQADTHAAMLEWINMLQKAIFKAKNAGNSVKVSLPFENILDIEQTEAFEFQQFIQIRAVGIDDSFVMDEYYFAYFTDAKETFGQLKSAWDRSQRHKALAESNNSDNLLSASTTDSVSPSLSISDLYDANSQPITIQALGGNMKATTVPSSSSIPASMSYAVTSALSVPSALRDLLYSSSDHPSPTIPHHPPPAHHTPDPSTADIADSSSSDEEDQAVVGWLDGKRRSGMKLVYGLLGGNAGSTATVYRSPDEDEDDESMRRCSKAYVRKHDGNTLFPHEEPIEERTRSNFRKYFVLPESEQLDAGKVLYSIIYNLSLTATT